MIHAIVLDLAELKDLLGIPRGPQTGPEDFKKGWIGIDRGHGDSKKGIIGTLGIPRESKKGIIGALDKVVGLGC